MILSVALRAHARPRVRIKCGRVFINGDQLGPTEIYAERTPAITHLRTAPILTCALPSAQLRFALCVKRTKRKSRNRREFGQLRRLLAIQLATKADRTVRFR
jgi:hypothetical protein